MEINKWYEICDKGGEFTEIMFLGFVCIMKVAVYDATTLEGVSVCIIEIDKESGVHAIKKALTKIQ